MRRRSNLLVLIGLASFVLGLVAVYLITNGDDDDTAVASNRVSVLVADGDIRAGALGDDLIQQGKVRVKEIPAEQKAADALTSPSELSGARLTASFLDGEQIRTSGVQTLGGARAEIPEGYEAVALNISYVGAGANTIIPGDRVNIYVNQTSQGQTAPDADGVYQTASRVELLLTNTLVLDVQQGNPNLVISNGDGSGATNGNLVVVVAVNTIDAEKVIYGSATPGNALYLSRVRIDENGNPAPAASGDADGRVFEDLLAESAADAHARNPQPTNG